MAVHETSMDRKRAPLQLDPSSPIHIFDTHIGPNNTSPDSIAPEDYLGPRTIQISSPVSGSEKEREPASGPHRSRFVSSGKSNKRQGKRSRVTIGQLVYLEHFFSLDRNPTSALQRDIGGLLGMQERQTQIWFQNRRAKAKNQGDKQDDIIETPPEAVPKLSTGFEMDLHNLIHEDESVTIIPCTGLSIGSWQRIETLGEKHDLVAYVCDIKKYFTWFIRSAGFGFKMEIPFETILTTTFTNDAPGSGVVSFQLSKPPIFYIKNIGPPDADWSAGHYWRRCSDWTEAHQATAVLRHELVGSAVQLLRILQSLPKTKVPLQYSSYRVEPPSSPIKHPLPRMLGLGDPRHRYQPEVTGPPHDIQALLSPLASTYSRDSGRPSPYSAPAVSHLQAPTTLDFNTPIHNEFTIQHHVQHGGGLHYQEMNGYMGVPISHRLAPRPYADETVPHTFLNKISRLAQVAYDTNLRMQRFDHPAIEPREPLSAALSMTAIVNNTLTPTASPFPQQSQQSRDSSHPSQLLHQF